MGLDQYLYARKHISGYEFYGEKARAEFAAVKEAAGMSAVKADGGIGVGLNGSVSLCVAYWRKANAIHGWFVREFARDGVDDCREMWIPREGLVSLRHVCEELLADRDPQKAAQLLPPTDGFFFGSYEIDDGYWGDLSHTVSQMNSVLNDWFSAGRKPAGLRIEAEETTAPLGDIDFYYQASW